MAHSSKKEPAHPFAGPDRVRERLEADFTRSFHFPASDGLCKTVTIERKGRFVTAEISYSEGVVVDATEESFEADGAVRLSVTNGGVYLSSHCSLLAERVRLKRTRFF